MAAKWFLAEAGSDAARDFLGQWAFRLIAPDLLLTELAVAIVRQANTDKAKMQQATALLKDLRQMYSDGVVRTERLDAQRVDGAAALAISLGHPLPNCVYLQLAIEFGCELATCDTKFRDRAIAIYPGVRLLSEYLAAKT